MLSKTLYVMGFEVQLEYQSIPLPRRGDSVLMHKFRDLCQGDVQHLKSPHGISLVMSHHRDFGSRCIVIKPIYFPHRIMMEFRQILYGLRY